MGTKYPKAQIHSDARGLQRTQEPQCASRELFSFCFFYQEMAEEALVLFLLNTDDYLQQITSLLLCCCPGKILRTCPEQPAFVCVYTSVTGPFGINAALRIFNKFEQCTAQN